MLGLFTKAKKVEKVNLDLIALAMKNRYWECEKVDGKEDTIVVHGKYRNNRKDFNKLYLKFVGAKVRFTDARGGFVSEVPKNMLYPEMKNILNVL